jgi:hypothetical protein
MSTTEFVFNNCSLCSEFAANKIGEGRHLGNGCSAFAAPPTPAKTTTTTKLEAEMGAFGTCRYTAVKTAGETRMATTLHIHTYSTGESRFRTSRRVRIT